MDVLLLSLLMAVLFEKPCNEDGKALKLCGMLLSDQTSPTKIEIDPRPKLRIDEITLEIPEELTTRRLQLPDNAKTSRRC